MAEGFNVVTAQSGEEGVRLLRSRRVEMAIADLAMPGMDGIQTVAALKVIDPDIQVIILTGYATVESTISAFRQGACDLLLKPIVMKELRAALAHAREKRWMELARPEPQSLGDVG